MPGARPWSGRLSVELDRNDLQLRRGQHAWLLADLSTRAAAHSLDERLAGQLMLALYRCGRQADALEHFHQMRLRLAEELGIDPGPSLQRLYEQILTADPGLTAPAARPAPASAEPPVPAQLPADVPVFTGRAQELAELDHLLAEPTHCPASASSTGGRATIRRLPSITSRAWPHTLALYTDLGVPDADNVHAHIAALDHDNKG